MSGSGRDRAPLLGFLWPRRDPGPVDADAVQSEWLRVPPRGPWRSAALIASSLAVVMGAGSVLLALATVDARPDAMLASLAAVVAGGCWLVVRGWVCGTYVNDTGIRLTRISSTTVIPWGAVSHVQLAPGRCPLLGLPIPVRADRVELTLADRTVGTHVTRVSPDLLGRPEAFEMAAGQVERWWRESRQSR